MPELSQDIRYGLARHGYDLGVHGVLVRIFNLDGLERAGAYVQRQFGRAYAARTQVIEHFLGEVQPRCRSGHRPFDARIDGLVGGLVALLALAVEVGRDRQLADGLQDLGECYGRVVPTEPNGIGVALLVLLIRAQAYSARAYINR